MTKSDVKSAYSYFGSKAKVAPIIWKAFGNISNYIEPFGGSLAVLLANPSPCKVETVNDKDHFIPNFWRSIKNDYETVIKYADFPVSEVDLHARHKFLISQKDFFVNMENDPDYFDAKIAGYWIYGQCASIGNNWLQPKGLNSMPLLSSAGGGIHGITYNIHEQFEKLQNRLRRVRVCCGDWEKLISPSITFKSKALSSKDITGVFLDPPYNQTNRTKIYKEDNNIFLNVYNWAIQNESNSKLRIAICGYEDDYMFPSTWTKYSWAANGGMSSLGNAQGKINSKKETIWFNSNCLEIL